ncbi:MAG: NADH-quinone oxidoreductase subunit N [Pirellulaceae bacterium]
MFVDLSTVSLVWPEFILILIASWIYLGGTLSPGRTLWTWLAIATYLVALLLMLRNETTLWQEVSQGFVGANGPLILDYLGQMSRYGCLLLGLLLTLVASRAGREELATEVLGTLMMLVAGLMLVCRANELVFLFVALELISIPTYVLLFLGRHDRASGEATIKYFFLSILASALLLYGMSFLYGVSRGTTILIGTQAVPGIREAVAHLPASDMSLFLIGLVLVVGGLGFRIAAVPFHFYAPDVYQGTTNINAGLLAVAPKIAGVLALIRVVVAIMPVDLRVGWQLMWVLAILTMTLGNVCALWQTNVRRLMAFSSIAHGGYMLIGFAVALASAASGGIGATLFYLVVYVLAALGVFAALAYLSDEQREVNYVTELAGLARTRPWVAAALALCLFSLAGIPPLGGFWGKFTIFAGAIRVALADQPGVSGWFLVLAVVGVLNAAVAAAYYLRIISAMYFTRPASACTARGGLGTWVCTAVCCVLVIAVGLWPGVALRSAASSDPLLQQSRSAISAGLPGKYDAVSLDIPHQARQVPKGGI